MCASCLILYCAVERNEPNEAGADMGADRECGVAGVRRDARDAPWRDGAGRGRWRRARGGRKWRGVVGRVVARAGQPWILLNADRVSYTKRAGRVSLMLVLYN